MTQHNSYTAAQLRTIKRLTGAHSHRTIAHESCPVILDEASGRELLILGNGAIMVCKRLRHDGKWTGPRARSPR